jgi:hypothetical protein
VNREDLLDNLAASASKREVVTLVVKPVASYCGDQVFVGRMLALGERYAGGQHPQAVLELDSGRVLVIGVSMIKDFAVGLARCAKLPRR